VGKAPKADVWVQTILSFVAQTFATPIINDPQLSLTHPASVDHSKQKEMQGPVTVPKLHIRDRPFLREEDTDDTDAVGHCPAGPRYTCDYDPEGFNVQ